MEKNLINSLFNSFEKIKKEIKWIEYRQARDLEKILWYTKRENFYKVIEKSKIACLNSWQPTKNHFLDTRKMVDLWSWSQREIDDYKLSRYACYLIAQNWDPTKNEIAFSQTYFAIQTRKQEIIEKRILEDRKSVV